MSDIDWTTWSEADLRLVLDEVNGELSRRYTIEIAPAQIHSLNLSLLAAQGHVAGDPWTTPVGATQGPNPIPRSLEDNAPLSYPKGWQVQHNGETWYSTIDANVWEPSVWGWQTEPVVVEPPEPETDEWPAWVQPLGSHDAYAHQAQVSHKEAHWVSNADGNVWEPGVFGWTLME